MLRRRAGHGAVLSWRRTLAISIALASLGVGIAAIALERDSPVDSLSVILGVAAIAAGILVVGERGGLAVSASFIIVVLAAVFLGPASAVAAAVIAELTATVVMKTRWRTVVFTNLPPAVVSAVAVATIIRSLYSEPTDTAGFYLAVALAGAAGLVASFLMFSAMRRLVYPSAEQYGLHTLVAFLPSAGLSLLVAVAGVSIKFKLGNAGIAFALAAVFTFSYMAHLLEQSRKRAQQYVSLSWGVLAGLMRSLDTRDERAARHSAAVARFARDIARAVGMSDAECELAHTAGLLHDIGRFALSDRVAERGEP